MNNKTNTQVFKLLTVLTGILAFSVESFAGLDISRLSMNPAAAVSGQSVNGTIEIGETCPSGGCVVSLKSSHADLALVPSTVTVAAGTSAKKTFSFIAGNAAAKTVVTITATFNGKSRSTGTTFSVAPSGQATTSLNCQFNGATVLNGQPVTAYQASSVASGQSCVSEVRTCSNGVLSGSYQYASCSVSAALPTSSIQPNQFITSMYQSDAAAYYNTWTAGSTGYLQVNLWYVADRETTIYLTNGYAAGLSMPATAKVPAGSSIVLIPVILAHSYYTSAIEVSAHIGDGKLTTTLFRVGAAARTSLSAPFQIYTRGEYYSTRMSSSDIRMWAKYNWESSNFVSVLGKNPGTEYKSKAMAAAQCSAAIPGGVLVAKTAVTEGTNYTPNGTPGYWYAQTFMCQ